MTEKIKEKQIILKAKKINNKKKKNPEVSPDLELLSYVTLVLPMVQQPEVGQGLPSGYCHTTELHTRYIGEAV